MATSSTVNTQMFVVGTGKYGQENKKIFNLYIFVVQAVNVLIRSLRKAYLS